jgi:DNA-binding transcriptional MocR family regulator
MIRRDKTTLSDSMADNLAKQIEEGLLPAGSKLPSIREYAEASGCSKNTVISAFDILTANGLIEPRRGSGVLRAAAREVGCRKRFRAILCTGGEGVARVGEPSHFIVEGIVPVTSVEQLAELQSAANGRSLGRSVPQRIALPNAPRTNDE